MFQNRKVFRFIRLTPMSRILFCLCGALLLAFITNTANAQTSTNESNATSSTTTAQESVARKTDNAVLTPNARTIDVRQPLILSDRAKERIINLAANMSNRMDATVERFEQIEARVQRRMEILVAEEFDTEQAAVHFVKAQTTLEQAKQELETIDDAVIGMIGSPTPYEMWLGTRSKYRRITTDLRTVQTALIDTVQLLKTVRKVSVIEQQVDSESPTTTPEVLQ